MLHPFSDCPRPQKPGYISFPVEELTADIRIGQYPLVAVAWSVRLESAIADKPPPRPVSRRATAGYNASRFVVIEQPMFSAVP